MMKKQIVLLWVLCFLLLPANCLVLWNVGVHAWFHWKLDSEFQKKVPEGAENPMNQYRFVICGNGFFTGIAKSAPERKFIFGNQERAVLFDFSETAFSFSYSDFKNPKRKIFFSVIEKEGKYDYLFDGSDFFAQDWNGDWIFDFKLDYATGLRYIPLNGIWMCCQMFDGKEKIAVLPDESIWKWESGSWKKCEDGQLERGIEE